MEDGLCYCTCNPQTTTDGRTTGHAVNCPLRPQIMVTPLAAPIVPSPFPSKDWQDGYHTGFAAGLAAGRSAG